VSATIVFECEECIYLHSRHSSSAVVQFHVFVPTNQYMFCFMTINGNRSYLHLVRSIPPHTKLHVEAVIQLRVGGL